MPKGKGKKGQDRPKEKMPEHQPEQEPEVESLQEQAQECHLVEKERGETRQFATLGRAITRILEYAKSEALETASKENILLRADRLLQLWEKANSLFLQLVGEETEQGLSEVEGSMAEMEECYFEAAEILRTKIAALSRSDQQTSNAGERQESQINVSLTLPVQQHDIKNTWGEFDGSLLKWIGFRDRFRSAIHENQEISTAYKYAYLRKSLTGKAARALGESNLNKDSYQEAWDRLIQLFEKPYHIAKEHLNQFFRLPVLQEKPTGNELSRMANVTYETIRQLKSLKVPVEHWDLVFVFGLHERLDPETKKQWELQRKSEMPKVEELLNFLDKQAGALETTRSVAAGAAGTSRQGHRSGNKPSAYAGSVPRVLEGLCDVCQTEAHPIYRCPEFQALNLFARKDLLSRRKICHNCLRKGHRKENCTYIKCKLEACRKDPAHNSMLCPVKQEQLAVLAVRNEYAQKDIAGKRKQ